MFDIKKYKRTVTNVEEASGEDLYELLFVFSGTMIILLVSPALYFITEMPSVAALGVVFGLIDLGLSQYLPRRMEFEDGGESEN